MHRFLQPGPTTGRKPAILVLSSTVVRGAVGGRAAVFALERLGFPVWSLSTVTLPWHPGHGPGTRIVPEPAAFAALLADLAASPRRAEIGGILSGYLGDAAQAEAIAGLVAAVKRANPAALYLLDPVLGDGGRLYVPEPVAAAMRDRLLPLADIVTPNPTELAFLAGADAPGDPVARARSLGRPRVAVTSAATEGETIATLLVTPERVLDARHDRIAGVPNGTGDLFAALLLAGLVAGAGEGEAEALRGAAARVLALARAAAETGADALPLALRQDALVAPAEAVLIDGLAGASC
ncbi:pyridoxal kinase [Prosthecomicrobium pneumaticum]|uniref:pyridoxal kinase n=1 Tax=Prosthecomicrobium pneumaticum TaxID=81895 RepID=A0A7W9FMS8_9HYPH|nr:pyridoxal kinase [Prosthecomicrobium pneumaticum]MBB5753524.1 pyridoxine kinase [Prosthecomicrobium pneumaticum]